MITNNIFNRIIFVMLFALLILHKVAYSQTIKALNQEMILIPGGEFTMGKDKKGDTQPEHKITLESFYMDKYEVTNAKYFKFCQETERKLPEFWGVEKYHCGMDFPNHPVVGINWRDAEAYAKWAGKRLPTEAEWECAARGGLVGKDFPNGDDIDSTKANYAIKGNYKGTAIVGSYPPNGFELYDMAGNVGEWVADWYDKEYYKNSPSKNPPGPEEGKFKIFRGGGYHSGPGCVTVHRRNALPSNWVDFNVGFRCVRDK